MSYRTSFAFEITGQAIGQLTEVVVIALLFTRIRSMGGFDVTAVLLMYGFSAACFGLADTVVGQVEKLPQLIRSGELDAMLIRPLGLLPQLCLLDIQLRRLGRLLSGLLILGVAAHRAPIDWTWDRFLLVGLCTVTGAVIFSAIFVAACSISFWVVEGSELANAVTYGGTAFASYPLTIYDRILRRLMAYVLPGAFISYYPTVTLLGIRDPLGLPGWFGWLGPVVALLSCLVAGLIWRTAVRRYRGTGS
ncbi:ABC transporter permease [Pseudonocardiaceae bacterium YIM PH 21723]|nr:ABC transporter permease [Pseudonocardiaceae bacterium YIM PH 21723]